MARKTDADGEALVTIPKGEWRRPTRRRVASIRDKLREVYGIPIMPPHEQPLDELVLTVLSQSTNDRNRDIAYERLRERFDGWQAVMEAPNAEVEEAIRPGGISKVKSRRIQDILLAIDATPEGRGLDLSFLREASVPEGSATSARCRASAARRPRACCCSPTACATCRSTRTSRASGCGCRSCARAPRSRSCTTRCSTSRPEARSSSSTSICCDMADAPVMRADLTVPTVC